MDIKTLDDGSEVKGPTVSLQVWIAMGVISSDEKPPDVVRPQKLPKYGVWLEAKFY